jgi:hypothetical protein
MKKNLLFVVSIAVFGLLFSGLVFAQDDKMVSAAADNYVISAKAGGVNHVEGKVSIARKNGKSGLLLKSDEIEIGDKVSTGPDGKAEILLNPGSFVRLGANSEFEFQTTDLDNLKLKLTAGSAILEVYADNEFKVTLDLPDADIELTKSGVYRVDVLPDGSGKISVWKGKVLVGDEKAEVKAGKSAIVKGKSIAVAKFDRDNKDDLDVWSQLRAKEAAKINERLQRNALANSLLGSYNRGGWNMYGTFGLWVFDPVTRRWCFLPFGSGWNSPYGYGYGFDIWSCRLPYHVYNQPPPTPNNPTNPTTPTTPPTQGTPMTPQQAQIREERRQSMQTPTFQRFENNQRNETRGGGGSSNSDSSTTRSNSDGGGWRDRRTRSDDSPTYTPSQPTYTPSQPSTPSTPSTPTTTPSETRSEKPTKDN